jgi:hypothetical protein
VGCVEGVKDKKMVWGRTSYNITLTRYWPKCGFCNRILRLVVGYVGYLKEWKATGYTKVVALLKSKKMVLIWAL